jgi:hypothetical protein
VAYWLDQVYCQLAALADLRGQLNEAASSGALAEEALLQAGGGQEGEEGEGPAVVAAFERMQRSVAAAESAGVVLYDLCQVLNVP